MDKHSGEQPYQFLQPYDLYRIQYTLGILLVDYLRAFQYQGLPINMDFLLDDLGALFELLHELEDKKR